LVDEVVGKFHIGLGHAARPSPQFDQPAVSSMKQDGIAEGVELWKKGLQSRVSLGGLSVGEARLDNVEGAEQSHEGRFVLLMRLEEIFRGSKLL
jgi:hypothetical protein